jgi:hypothetical protein
MNEAATTVHRSPPLGPVAVVFLGLFVASIAANAILTGGAPYPTPYRPIAELQAHYLRFANVLELTALLQLAAMMPLAVYAATAVSRLLFHRVTVAGVHIALFGGLMAALFLGVSALASWALSQPGVAAESGALRSMQLIAFAAGGFAHTATLGLFLAGLSVPSLAFRLLPPWLGWLGLGIAAICLSSMAAMVLPAASLLLPLGRFPAYLWLIAAGFRLPKTRAGREG